MDYMFLIYADEQMESTRTLADSLKRRERGWAILDDARARGVFKAANPLYPTSAARTARPNHTSVSITDGPFAETKEALGGFWIIDCRDVDEAEYWASRLAQTGCGSAVEFRPIAALPLRLHQEEFSVLEHA
jgi:hypothetical protein